MDLTITQAATLLGISPRAVRGRLLRGQITGRKRNGRWLIPHHTLPLDAARRRRLHERADGLRDALEEALPAAVRQRPAHRLEDLDVFRLGRELLAGLDGHAAGPHLRAALRDIAAAHFEFDPSAKLIALRAARARRGRSLHRRRAPAPAPADRPHRCAGHR